MSLFAFDPGRNTGWAEFDDKKLVAAGVMRDLSATAIVAALPGWASEVVIESPRWYPREHRIDTNDLLDLAVLVGQILGFYRAVARYEGRAVPTELVYPRTWKGTVPKAIHNKRVLAALTDEERALLPRRPRAKDVDHNLLDAVGIGLWKLGRM